MTTCIVCEKEFTPKHPATRYCSQRCRGKEYRASRGCAERVKKEVECKQCGKKFFSVTTEFCSSLCRGNYRNQLGVVRYCECGVVLKHGNQIRCPYCQDEYVRNKPRKKHAYKSTEKKLLSAIRQKHIRRSRVDNLKCTLTTEEWNQTLSDFDNRCAFCDKAGVALHQEHFIPLTKGGEYTKNNIIPSCKSCNSSKSNKQPLDWLVKKEHGLSIFAKIVNYLKSQ